MRLALARLTAPVVEVKPTRSAKEQFAYVHEVVNPNFKDDVLADAPRIPDRGSDGLPSLPYGPLFGPIVADFCCGFTIIPAVRRSIEVGRPEFALVRSGHVVA